MIVSINWPFLNRFAITRLICVNFASQWDFQSSRFISEFDQSLNASKSVLTLRIYWGCSLFQASGLSVYDSWPVVVSANSYYLSSHTLHGGGSFFQGILRFFWARVFVMRAWFWRIFLVAQLMFLLEFNRPPAWMCYVLCLRHSVPFPRCFANWMYQLRPVQ